MEDPVDFDVWAIIERGHTAGVVPWLQTLRPDLTPFEVRRTLNASAVQGSAIVVCQRIGWERAQKLRAAPPVWCRNVRVYQAGHGPGDIRAKYCERHDLYHGSCLGCHVCQNFYGP